MNDIFPFLISLEHNWQKRRGIIAVLFICIILYFSFLKDILQDMFKVQLIFINLVYPLLICLLLIVFWLINTRRLGWIKSNRTTVGLFIRVDEESSEVRIKKIIESLVSDINSEYRDISIRIFPINYIGSSKILTKYLERKNHVLDCLIYADIKSGNSTNEKGIVVQKINIDDIIFVGDFNLTENLKVFKTSVNIAKDMKIRNINKNWSYIESESLIDKTKIAANFKDAVLFFIGIYLVYQNKFESSLEILKTLHDPSSSTARVVDNKIIGNKKFIGAARLNEILLNLFALNASRFYIFEDKKEKAFNALKECEQLFGQNPNSFENYISSARFSYELNDLPGAVLYTQKAKELRPASTEIYLNQAFFSILDNNIPAVCKNYRELAHVYKHKNYINYIDSVAFLEREKLKYNKNSILFEFGIGTLSFLYGDKKLGRKILTHTKDALIDNAEYICITDLITKLLNKGPFKSVYNRKKEKKKKRKKRSRRH